MNIIINWAHSQIEEQVIKYTVYIEDEITGVLIYQQDFISNIALVDIDTVGLKFGDAIEVFVAASNSAGEGLMSDGVVVVVPRGPGRIPSKVIGVNVSFQ